MSHIPVNHHLRPFYRVLALLAGIYVTLFGVVGVFVTADTPALDRGDVTALGLRTNLAFSIASVFAGLAIILAFLVGRNVDRFINLWGGIGFLAAGVAMMAVLRTDMNVLNFSMATCIVSFVVGMVLFAAGLYVRTGSVGLAKIEELVRHGGH